VGWIAVSLASGVPDSIGNPLIALLGGSAVTLGMFWIQTRTEWEIPRLVQIGIIGLVGFWTIEAVTPGLLSTPLQNGLSEMSQVIWIAALGIALYAIRGWLKSRSEPDTQVTLSLGGDKNG
jgi:hypothetical protein